MTFQLQPVKNDEPSLAGAPMIEAAQKLFAYLGEHDAGLPQKNWPIV